MVKVLGIDEAARGPVIGPMIVAGAMIEEGNEGQLGSVKDSKLVSQKNRIILERHLKKEQPKLKLQFPQGQSQENPVQNTAQDNPGNEDNSNHQSMADSGFAPVCPDCGGTLEVAEGCMKCHSCGYTKCG